MQHDVLGGDELGELAIDAHQHVARLLLRQRRGREHVLHLGGPDAEGQRPERAVRGGVRVPADADGAGPVCPSIVGLQLILTHFFYTNIFKSACNSS